MTTVSEDHSPLKNWKRNLIVAWVAQFFCIIGLDICLPFIPFYIRELGITDANRVNIWAGAISSGCAIAMAVLSPLWGLLADRKGPKLMAERAAFGGAITLVAIAFVSTAPQLAVIRVIQCALTGMTLAFVTLVSSCVPLSRIGFSLGLMQMGAYLGLSVGPLIGGVVADTFGYRRTFGAAGILPLIAGILVFTLVDDKVVPLKEAEANNGTKHGARTIFHSGLVRGVMLALSAVCMANAASRPILPLFVESLLRNPNLINTSTGAVYGALSLASAVSALLTGRLGDRIGYRNILLICGAGAALTCLAQSLSTNLTVFIVSTFAMGLFFGGLLPTANSILVHAAPKGYQGTVFGLSSSVSSGGRILGPMLGVTVASTWGMRSTFVLSGALFALVTAWVALVVKPRGFNSDG